MIKYKHSARSRRKMPQTLKIFCSNKQAFDQFEGEWISFHLTRTVTEQPPASHDTIHPSTMKEPCNVSLDTKG
jgi:hypothetical protein